MTDSVPAAPLDGALPLDYHLHSDVSCDSRATMAQMCRSALERGLREISFTEHYDLHPLDSCPGYYRPERYFANLEAARREFEPQGLTLRAGVEVGELHRWRSVIQPVLDEYPYDVVLGSLHWIGDQSVFDPDYFRSAPPEETIPAYFSELAAMTHAGGFDVLAHADVFKRAASEVYERFTLADWEDWVRPVWQACIDNGIALEINTAGLRGPANEAHPSLAALRWYAEMGGERLTLGSDGHRPEHVGYRLDAALDLARAAGLNRVCSFQRRQVANWIRI